MVVEHCSAACKRFAQDSYSAVPADWGSCFDGLVDQDMSIGSVVVVLRMVDKGLKEAGRGQMAKVQMAEVGIGLG